MVVLELVPVCPDLPAVMRSSDTLDVETFLRRAQRLTRRARRSPTVLGYTPLRPLVTETLSTARQHPCAFVVPSTGAQR